MSAEHIVRNQSRSGGLGPKVSLYIHTVERGRGGVGGQLRMPSVHVVFLSRPMGYLTVNSLQECLRYSLATSMYDNIQAPDQRISYT